MSCVDLTISQILSHTIDCFVLLCSFKIKREKCSVERENMRKKERKTKRVYFFFGGGRGVKITEVTYSLISTSK